MENDLELENIKLKRVLNQKLELTNILREQINQWQDVYVEQNLKINELTQIIENLQKDEKEKPNQKAEKAQIKNTEIKNTGR